MKNQKWRKFKTKINNCFQTLNSLRNIIRLSCLIKLADIFHCVLINEKLLFYKSLDSCVLGIICMEIAGIKHSILTEL